jgi:hypothetical protein
MRVLDNVDIAFEIVKSNYRYVSVGSSKEVYRESNHDDVVIKIPRALDDCYGLNDGTISIRKPNNISDVDDMLLEIQEQSCEGMVWPIGQLLVEVFVWEKIKELEQEGYDISCFAALKDYYFDKKGVPVIIQEQVERRYPNSEEWEQFSKKFDIIYEALASKYDIHLDDVREGNVGFSSDGEPKLYDFGMINDMFYNYSDYDTYAEDCAEYEESCDRGEEWDDFDDWRATMEGDVI